MRVTSIHGCYLKKYHHYKNTKEIKHFLPVFRYAKRIIILNQNSILVIKDDKLFEGVKMKKNGLCDSVINEGIT